MQAELTVFPTLRMIEEWGSGFAIATEEQAAMARTVPGERAPLSLVTTSGFEHRRVVTSRIASW